MKYKAAFYVFIALFVVVPMTMVGCSNNTYADYYTEAGRESGVMLVDYYSRTVSAVGGNGHFEMVLSTADSEDAVRLDVYQKEDEASEETCVSYLVPSEAAERCFEVINKYKIHKWNGMKNTVSIDGVLEVCKFRHGKTYYRVTTEEMPTNGEEAMAAISGIMREYIKEECLFYE